MAVGIVPMTTITVEASEWEGFIPISTPEDLLLINQSSVNMQRSYYLTNDIDLSGWTNWQPIASWVQFSGIFDGNGFAIKNLTSTRGGLFELLRNGATVRNLGLVNVNINTNNGNAGALAGSVSGTSGTITIENVYVTGTVTSGTRLASGSTTARFGHSAGGLIGGTEQNRSPSVIFRDCLNLASVTSERGNLTLNDGGHGGGIFGGGGANATFVNSVNRGTVTGGGNIGGIAGHLNQQMTSCYNFGTVTDNHNSAAGGLVGIAASNAIVSSSATIGELAVTTNNSNRVIEARTSVPLSEFRQQDTYVGFDFDNIWHIDPNINDGFPILRIMLPKYSFNITARDGGTVTGGGIFTQGNQVVLRATPSAGHTFGGWYAGNTLVSEETTLNYTAESNITLEARFTPNQYIFNITAGAGGTVRGGGTHNHGTSVTLTAAPNIGYTFGGWFDGNNLVSTERNFVVTATSNRTLQARFSLSCTCRNCTDCGHLGGRFGFGRLRGADTSPGVQDALAILRQLVGLSSVIDGNENARIAANIVTPGAAGNPTIQDALQILRYLVGLSNLIDGSAARAA
jgi:uncharacterized repeat protein (TIGR02543 family)